MIRFEKTLTLLYFQVKVANDGMLAIFFIIVRYLLVFVLLPAMAAGYEREGLGFECQSFRTNYSTKYFVVCFDGVYTAVAN